MTAEQYRKQRDEALAKIAHLERAIAVLRLHFEPDYYGPRVTCKECTHLLAELDKEQLRIIEGAFYGRH